MKYYKKKKYIFKRKRRNYKRYNKKTRLRSRK